MPAPSGVNRGPSWWKSPPVTCRGVPPSALTTKMWRYPAGVYPEPSRR